MEEDKLLTPELMEAIEEQRLQQAERMKQATLSSKAIRIMRYLQELVYARGMNKTIIIKRIHKECSKYLVEEAL